MGDSTEKNLKSYRNSELKWFLLANILLMLVTSGGLKFDSQDANVFSFISEIISITAVSSCAYILTFIFDSILPPIFKVKLIFWWKKQPSCTIFTDMLKNLQDNRFTLSTVLEKYNDIYVIIDNLPKGIDQTPYWYSIYERNRSNPIVFGSNRDYLLLRDMHAQMVMLMVVYVALVLVTGCNLVRRTEKGRLRRRGWGLRWEKAQKGGKGTNLRGFFED